MQIQLTCVDLLEHGRVTMIQEVEVDEEVQQLWCGMISVLAGFDEPELRRHSAM